MTYVKRNSDDFLPLHGRAPTYFERFMRSFGVQGPLPDQFEQKAQLGVTLLDLTAPEFYFGGRGLRRAGAVVLGAVAGQRPFLQLQNGIAGMLVIVDRIILNSTGATFDVQYGLTDTAPAAGAEIGYQQLDSRHGAVGAGRVFQGTNAAPTVAPNALFATVPASPATLELVGPWVLGETMFGTNNVPLLTVVGITVNLAFRGMIFWRERPAVPQEF